MHIFSIIIEAVFSLALFINALLFLPQALKLIQQKKSGDISFTTFAGFNLIQLAMIAHGILVHDYLLVWGMMLTFVTCGFVSFLIIYYRVKNAVSE